MWWVSGILATLLFALSIALVAMDKPEKPPYAVSLAKETIAFPILQTPTVQLRILTVGWGNVSKNVFPKPVEMDCTKMIQHNIKCLAPTNQELGPLRTFGSGRIRVLNGQPPAVLDYSCGYYPTICTGSPWVQNAFCARIFETTFSIPVNGSQVFCTADPSGFKVFTQAVTCDAVTDADLLCPITTTPTVTTTTATTPAPVAQPPYTYYCYYTGYLCSFDSMYNLMGRVILRQLFANVTVGMQNISLPVTGGLVQANTVHTPSFGIWTLYWDINVGSLASYPSLLTLTQTNAPESQPVWTPSSTMCYQLSSEAYLSVVPQTMPCTNSSHPSPPYNPYYNTWCVYDVPADTWPNGSNAVSSHAPLQIPFANLNYRINATIGLNYISYIANRYVSELNATFGVLCDQIQFLTVGSNVSSLGMSANASTSLSVCDVIISGDSLVTVGNLTLYVRPHVENLCPTIPLPPPPQPVTYRMCMYLIAEMPNPCPANISATDLSSDSVIDKASIVVSNGRQVSSTNDEFYVITEVRSYWQTSYDFIEFGPINVTSSCNSTNDCMYYVQWPIVCYSEDSECCVSSCQATADIDGDDITDFPPFNSWSSSSAIAFLPFNGTYYQPVCDYNNIISGFGLTDASPGLGWRPSLLYTPIAYFSPLDVQCI